VLRARRGRVGHRQTGAIVPSRPEGNQARPTAPGQNDAAINQITGTIEVLDQGHALGFSFEDMLRYHGPGSPAGVAHAFKVLERALPLLEPHGLPERREVSVHTAFAGPGARDAFELVTRAVTENRYVVDPGLERPERGRALERFVFRIGHRKSAVTLIVREGYVTHEFIELARRQRPTSEERRQLAVLKREMADRVMAARAIDVYDVCDCARHTTT
jgi:hypothetical protein